MNEPKDNKSGLVSYNYIIIPSITIGVIIINWVLSLGSSSWYKTLNMPLLRLSNWAMIGLWWASYILGTIAAVLMWNNGKRSFTFWFIIFFFIVTLIFSVVWNYLFFYQHVLGVAFLASISLTFAVFVLLLLIQPISLSIALLLYPAMAWTSFICYLNYMLWILN